MIVGVTGFGNGNAGQPDNAQYAGVDMIPARQVPSGSQVFAGVYYLADAALPANAGNYTVSVGASDVNNTFALSANVLELVNAEQATGPIDSVGGSGSAQSFGVHKASDTVTVSSAGELIYSVVGFFGSLASSPNASGQQMLSNCMVLISIPPNLPMGGALTWRCLEEGQSVQK